MQQPSHDLPMTNVWLALGANLGNAVQTVCAAVQAMDTWPQTQVIKASSLYRTAPVDATGPDFINAVVQIHTGLSPHALLAQCQQAEQRAGRERPYRNAPRTLDIDIVLYGDVQMQTDTLTLPHPRMHQRAFVLVPLAEIAPEKVSAMALQAVATQQIDRLPHGCKQGAGA